MDRTVFQVIGVAVLLLAGCGHQPETAAVAAKPAPSAADQGAELEHTTKLLQQAEADSGYCRCLLVKAQESLESAPPGSLYDDPLLEQAAHQAEAACQAESGKFMTSLRASGANTDVRTMIHGELLQAMRYNLGLSDQPAALFLPSQQPQTL